MLSLAFLSCMTVACGDAKNRLTYASQPGFMTLTPSRTFAGESVKINYAQPTQRGVGYVLAAEESAEPLFLLYSDRFDNPSNIRSVEYSTADIPSVPVTDLGPDTVVLPTSLKSADYLLCIRITNSTATTSTPQLMCEHLTVTRIEG